jgi:4a-hydroxytetrahydrobiopterin dehydratase
MTLYSQKCVACRRDSPKVTDAEISELHPQVADWELTEVDGVKRLARTLKFDNFTGALDFTVKVAEEAEAEGHHPKLTLEWGRVGVEWWTHKIRGLHRNDFVMAAKTDQIYAQAYS